MYSGGKPAGKHSKSERELLSINSDSEREEKAAKE